jgi:N-acetyl-gamma-glutamyl-phosphate/LysW-gamma-L-alpha-aminoadipyl-6-phosphate reductase
MALPHGRAARDIEQYAELAPRIIDCSADFRLRDAESYLNWYGYEHPNPEWLARFVYGLPEQQREAIRTARYVSGVGCNATAVNLALMPLIRGGLLDSSQPIIADVKVGSSEAGNEPNEGSHHPERSHVVRSYAPVGHRHTAEVQQVLGITNVHLSVTAVELVRGALATCHSWLRTPVTDRELWQTFRRTYNDEPFVRIVKERSGPYRLPEPKLVAGCNMADVGWSVDEQTGRIVTVAAIDNLQKGAAGTAVQCLNLMHDFPETTGLDRIGLHPL